MKDDWRRHVGADIAALQAEAGRPRSARWPIDASLDCGRAAFPRCLGPIPRPTLRGRQRDGGRESPHCTRKSIILQEMKMEMRSRNQSGALPPWSRQAAKFESARFRRCSRKQRKGSELHSWAFCEEDRLHLEQTAHPTQQRRLSRL